MTDLTPKQEAFVQTYIETGNASEAYRLAYDTKASSKTVHEKASRLLAEGKVRARLKALQEKHSERHEVTVDSLVLELDEARSLAMRTKAPGAAVSAIMGKGKLLGLVVDRNEHSGKDGEPIKVENASTDELISRIARLSAREGKGGGSSGSK